MKNTNYQLFLQAKELTKQGKYIEAIKILRKIYELEPNDCFIKFELARALIKNGKTKQEGKELLIQLLDTQSKNYALLELGKLEASEENNTKARFYFEQLLNTKDRNFALLELGRLEVSEENNNKARFYFEQLLNTQNKNYALLELGKLEVSKGNNNKARFYFEQLLNTQNKNYALLELGKLEASKENNTKARFYFEQLLNTKDRNFALLEMGKLEASEGNNKQARYFFEQLLNTKDRNFALLELGRLEVSEGNNNKARFYFEQLLNTQNKNYALLELGKLEASEGNNNKARFYFEQLLNTQNKNYALLEMGKLEASEGNNKQARYFFEQLLNTKDKNYALQELIFLNIKEYRYDNAYELLKIIQPNIMQYNVYINAKVYLEYKLGLINNYDKYCNNYFALQLFNYDEAKTLDHIEKHLDENRNKRIHTVFNNDIDLKDLLSIVKDKIQDLNPVSFSICDKYLVNCDMCVANIDSEDTQHLIAVTLPNSKDILTMYPVLVSRKELDKPKQLVKKKDCLDS